MARDYCLITLFANYCSLGISGTSPTMTGETCLIISGNGWRKSMTKKRLRGKPVNIEAM